MRVRRHRQFAHHEPDEPAEPLPETTLEELPWHLRLFVDTIPYSIFAGLFACIALFFAAIYGLSYGLMYVLRPIIP